MGQIGASWAGRLLGGRYELRRLLGRGGMARVYEGWDSVLGRRVAVKVLDDRLSGEPALMRRFSREARAAAGLLHPNIVAVHDAGKDGELPYIVMELVEGTTLAGRLAGGPLGIGVAVAIAADVCLALEHAHRRGVIHRDIKPGNILLDPGGGVKVADFGIAKVAALPGTTGEGATPGTAEYLAPEQAWSEGVDARADLYALGCCLYEMLTGGPPFGTVGDPLAPSDSETGEHLTSVQIAVRHLLQPPIPPGELRGGIPQPLERIVMKALAKRPSERHQSAEDLRRELLPLASTPDADAGPGADGRRRRPIAGHGTALAGLIGVTLLVAGVTVATLDPGTTNGADQPTAAGPTTSGPTASAPEVATPESTVPPPSGSSDTTRPPTTTPPPRTAAPPAAEQPGDQVPNVVGLHVDEASAMLGERGIGTAVEAIPTSDRGRLLRVLSQDPPAGTTVRPGLTINVVVPQWFDANADA
jgi:serine/threonine protein kinase